LILFIILAVTLNDILRAAIALGIASVVLSVIFFNFDSPMAAVYELSICAGLITVLFTSTISLIREEGKK
jgi:NADH-quinone oxidoreductase subunit J